MAQLRTRRRRGRSVGRPPDGAGANVRAQLLDAAEQLFLKHGFERVTARQLGAAAGTSAAMIHYYFGNKLGLFRAMLERAIEPFRALLATTLERDGAMELDVATIVTAHMRTAAANPWIATLMVNEVFPDKGRFRTTFLRSFASRLLPMLVAFLERGRAQGRFRADIEPRLTALSLLGSCLFPFLSRSVTAPLLGLELEGAQLDQLIAHTTGFIGSGIERDREGHR